MQKVPYHRHAEPLGEEKDIGESVDPVVVLEHQAGPRSLGETIEPGLEAIRPGTPSAGSAAHVEDNDRLRP